eukprot:NODE_2634_length_1152_cov_103.295558_g2412_i0.p1 GENE.NODE_2634_length_1152_cov_103.295558_g2412_i0~~NODE_2634_length_1152_cov_103.295558_g2412_i0.p1  ORF type:complete len:323 (+),score=51.05 NODE_2634_length_1152_cov_103.295558_g2412_i0:55-1023(+)
MPAVRTLLLLAAPFAAVGLSMHELAVSPELVARVNSLKTTWTASVDQGSFFKNATIGNVRGLLGALREGDVKLPSREYDPNFKAPISFDSSKRWPYCPSIMNIRDQSSCGSCWAVAGAAAMSDRYCTQAGKNVTISASDLMSCCTACGFGCNGGYPAAAMEYWVRSGLYSESCQPYPFPRCEHHVPAGKYPVCPPGEFPTPSCARECKDGSAPYAYHGKRAYGVSGESQMQQELMKYGPIEVTFNVYSDFVTYKSGVYQHVSGSELGGHAVKLIGWGVTPEGTKYWIINNSWNEDWGLHGQFWIRRGVNECGIEEQGSIGDA